jgi:hypothetical protein
MEMQAGVPEGSVLSPTLYNTSKYINDAAQIYGVHLSLFADDTCLYVTDRNKGFVVRNFSVVSAQWRPGVSAGILKLTKIRLKGSSSLANVDRLSPILHWMDETFHL